MSVTLYRKYRPQTFKEVIGQNHIKTTIQSELESDKIAHAYLFSGPRGLGKTTMARLLAKSINCLNRKDKESEPCNVCDACKETMATRSLDVIEIDAASHTGVDNVRENIISNARFTPTSRKFKVFIIDEVHMLSTAAFNALLKTLEEPPAHAIFILATTEIHKVPETIISRCQHFNFRKVPESDIVNRLNHIVTKEGKSVDKSILENIAYYAEGCIRDSESLLGQILSLDDKKITAQQAELVLPRSRFDLALELIDYLIKKDSAQAIILINHLVQEGIDLEKFSANLIEILRKILSVKISSQLKEFATSLGKDLEARVTKVAKSISLNLVIHAIEVLISRRQEIKFANITQLPLELAVLEIINDKNEDKTPPPKNPGSAVKDEKAKEKEPENQKPTTPKKTINKVKLTIEQVKDKWEEVLICLKKYNQSLASTLKIGQPSEVKTDGTLELCFKHKFHQQRVNDLKNKQVLEKVLREVLGHQLIVKPVVVKNLPNEKVEIQALTENKDKKDDESLNNILETFGGQVVD